MGATTYQPTIFNIRRSPRRLHCFCWIEHIRRKWAYHGGSSVTRVALFSCVIMYIVGLSIGLPKVSHTIDLPTLFTTFGVIRATLLIGAYEIVQVKQAPPNNNEVMDNQSQHLNPEHGIQFQMVPSKLLT